MSCDENYAPHCGVTLFSLLRHTAQPDRVNIFLIDNQIKAENQSKLASMCSAHGAKLTFLPADVERFQGIPAFRYGASAYQRLALSELLPTEVSKVIYLDCDILVAGDIAELWETDLVGAPLAAVENFSPKAHLGLGFKRTGYFNSGVLVIDVDYWRKNSLSDAAIHFILENKETIRFVDQCALNHLYQNKWHKLAPEWNVQGDIFRVIKKYLAGCGYGKQALTNASRSPKIVHFIGEQKPWTWECFSPYLAAYEQLKAKSPWKDNPKKDESIPNRLKHYLSIKKRLTQFARKSSLSM